MRASRPVLPGGATRLVAADLSTARDRGAPVGTGIDLAVAAGRVTALTGPNGIGKSTLGLTLAGLLPPVGGTVAASDELVALPAAPPTNGSAPASWRSAALAARIGTVFQDPAHQFVARSVREELATSVRAVRPDLDRAAVDDRVTATLDDLGLLDLADADPFTLSGGEQRRLGLGVVLVVAPPVVVLDEPTSGQDRGTWQRVVDRLGALADAGHAVVVVTHDEELLCALDADVHALGAGGAGAGLPAPKFGDADELRAAGAEARPAGRASAPASRPAAAAPRGALARVQPVAALLGTFALAALLVTTLDVVSAATALVLELLLLPLLRLPVRSLVLRLVPLLIAAPLAGLSIALYGTPSGETLLDAGFVHVTTGSIVLAVATVLRVLAIGLPAVALFVRSDPTDLADGLAQILRLPARFVLGAMTALRMTGLLHEDWGTLRFARRARGLGDRGPVRSGASMAFALLVIALRRATTLALAMESRGFGAPVRRTWARPARWRGRETLLLLVCAAVGLASVAAAIAAGTWHGV